MNARHLSPNLNFCLRLLLLPGILLLSGQTARAYDVLGHYTVSYIADDRLTASTRGEVKELLHDASMAEVSAWGSGFSIDEKEFLQMPNKDAVKRLAADAEVRYFFQSELSDDPSVHEALMPLFQKDYSIWQLRNNVRRNDNIDLVEMINLCVKSLQRDQDATKRIPRSAALIFLIHLICDLHQPLHTAQAYLDISQPLEIKIRDGAHPGGLLPDRGGQFIRVAGSRTLHEYWQNILVKNACANHGFSAAKSLSAARKYASWLQKNLQDVVASSPAPYTSRSVIEWFNQSHQIAESKVYAGLVLSRQAKKNGPIYDSKYYAHFPPEYQKENIPVIDQQLLLAGIHLAQVLNAALDPTTIASEKTTSRPDARLRKMLVWRDAVSSEFPPPSRNLIFSSSTDAPSLSLIQDAPDRIDRRNLPRAPENSWFSGPPYDRWEPIKKFPETLDSVLAKFDWHLDGDVDNDSLPLKRVTQWKTISRSDLDPNTGKFGCDCRLAFEITARLPNRWRLRYVAIQSRHGQSYWQFTLNTEMENLVNSEVRMFRNQIQKQSH